MAKIRRHNKAPLKTTPDTRFEHIHIGVIGPLTLSKGNCYALTVIDRFTRWVEVIPLAGKTTDAVDSNRGCRLEDLSGYFTVSMAPVQLNFCIFFFCVFVCLYCYQASIN